MHKSFGAKQVLDGLDLDVGRGRIGGRDRRLGHRQVGAAEVHPRHPAARSGLDRDRRRGGDPPVAPRARGGDAQVRHAVPGRGAVRQPAGLGERRLRPAPGQESCRGAEAKERAIEVLGRVGLPPAVADLSPAELSGGMQKRVGLARAIATQPEILFFDEPTTGLDPIMADVINDLIARRGAAARRDRALDHPRSRMRAQDRRPDRDALSGQDHLAGPGRRRSTTAAIPTSTSSSTAAPTARSSSTSARPEAQPAPGGGHAWLSRQLRQPAATGGSAGGCAFKPAVDLSAQILQPCAFDARALHVGFLGVEHRLEAPPHQAPDRARRRSGRRRRPECRTGARPRRGGPTAGRSRDSCARGRRRNGRGRTPLRRFSRALRLECLGVLGADPGDLDLIELGYFGQRLDRVEQQIPIGEPEVAGEQVADDRPVPVPLRRSRRDPGPGAG